MNRTTLLRTGAWLAVVTWAATIVTLSSLSGPQIEELNWLELWDKAAHFIAFVAGALCVVLALRWSTAWSWRKVVLVAAISVSLFGAIDEWHQLYTPNRTGADVLDWLADTLGAIAGATATRSIYARYQRKNLTAPAGD